MRKIRYYILSSILFLSISCVNDIRKTYNNFRHETINFPAMIKVENREIKPYNTHYGIPKMIFYFDSLECNHCRIEHLLDYNIIYKTTENAPEFDVMIIFSPRQDDYDSVFYRESNSERQHVQPVRPGFRRIEVMSFGVWRDPGVIQICSWLYYVPSIAFPE